MRLFAKRNMDLMDVFDTIENMKAMKRYKGPTDNYFPTVAEINTYGRSDVEAIIPYLIWLEENLSPAAMEFHKEARKALHNVIEELKKEGKIDE